MKHLVVAIILFFTGIGFLAQGQTISYEYDDAGNRVARKVITLSQAPMVQKSDSICKPEPIEDLLGKLTITIYPNPTKGDLKVSVDGGDEHSKCQYLVFDIKGNVLKKGRIIPQGETSISLAAYANGAYYLQISNNSDKQTFKVIKKD